jgi:hypothetical protein
MYVCVCASKLYKFEQKGFWDQQQEDDAKKTHYWREVIRYIHMAYIITYLRVEMFKLLLKLIIWHN